MQGKITIACSTILGVFLGWALHSLWIQFFLPQTDSNWDAPTQMSNADPSLRRDAQRSASLNQRNTDASLFRDNADVKIFRGLLNTVSQLQAEGDHSGAIETLLQASLEISNLPEGAEFEFTLAETMDRASRELISQERYAVLDQIYERLTLELPEYAEYYLKLGLLRIRMGNEPAAFQPLAQIQNHSRYGAHARRLLIQLEESQTVAATWVEEIPLSVRSGQYAVEAIVDPDRNGREATIRLLVDTGAAITAIDASVLSRLGYNLNEVGIFRNRKWCCASPSRDAWRTFIGESSVNRLTIGALNFDAQKNIDGLLGMNFLRHFKFHLNQDSQKLELQRRAD